MTRSDGDADAGAHPLVCVPGLERAANADASVVHADSEVNFLAGCCPLDAEGRVVALGDIAAQTYRALLAMQVVLDHCEVALDDVALLRMLVVASRPDDLGAAWDVVRDHFGSHEVPATLHGVSVLGYPGQLVELEPIAVRGPR